MQYALKYDNDKDTFPLSTAVTDWEVSFGQNTRINVAYIGSDSTPPAFPIKTGDWVYVDAEDYVGLVKRVVSNVAAPWVEVEKVHGKTAVDQVFGVVKNSEAFKDVTWVINSDSSTPASATIDGVTDPDGTSFGGAKFQDPNFRPLIIDATGTIIHVIGIV